MSNSTSTPTLTLIPTSTPQSSDAPPSSTVAPPSSSISSANPVPPTTVPTTTSLPTTSSSSVILPSSTSSTSTTSSTSSTSSTFSSTTSSTTTSSTSTTSQAPTTTSPGQTVTITPTSNTLVTTTITSVASSSTSSRSSSTSSSASNTATAIASGSGGSSSGLSTQGIVAIAVVIPIVGIALLVLGGLFLWRKRTARKDAEDLRRKEVEEYGYNPNDDPTLPAVGGVAAGAAASNGPFEMREDDQGYRGWGATTVAGSSARNPSTTMSTAAGPAFSEGTSPTHGPVSDTQSANPLLANGRPLSESSEALGVMGPAAAKNQSGVNRGPSNASSSYSAANRSDGSGELGVAGGAYGQAQYYSGENYSADTYGTSPPGRAEMGGQPVIRDNLARRATRIENPSHFPQPSAGISQNF